MPELLPKLSDSQSPRRMHATIFLGLAVSALAPWQSICRSPSGSGRSISAAEDFDACPGLERGICPSRGRRFVCAGGICARSARRFALPRLLTMSWGAGLTADMVKLSIRRLRPREFDYSGGVFDTFGPLWNVGRGHGEQSFPSAHAASAVGLAVALSWLYPRGRILFAGLAILACMQRIATSAHFPSDVLAGAAVGYLFAQCCIGQGWLAPRFDRWESTWRRPRPQPTTGH